MRGTDIFGFTILRYAGWLLACGACASPPPVPPGGATRPLDDLSIPPLSSAAPPSARPLPPATGGSEGVRHPNDLHDHKDLIGKKIVVDVFESLWDSAHSSGADEGEYDVHVVDVGAWRFKITPDESEEERSAGALATLPPDLRPPIRVHGIAAPTKFGVRLVAHAVEQLSFPSPTRIPNADVLTSDPKRWDRQYVEVEDDWTVGFEGSYLGKGGTWLDMYPSVAKKCEPSAPKNGYDRSVRVRRVHVIGFAYTATGAYGHLGGGRAKLAATSVTFVDPKRPECR